ncbi:MAG: pentapeptide repeat-containing protein, partial [Coleofasciculaceae cyanobacterium]
EILTERVARNTHRYINEAVAAAGEKVKSLAELFRNGGRELLERYLSIDSYLEEQIAEKPKEKVFSESFSFRDIYVPLKAKPVNKNGEVNEKEESFCLETWAKDILNDTRKQAQVMFIQGGPGRGKSVFCRMFADLVRQDFHPIWTPILICLRDIATLQRNFRETLREAVTADFAASDDGWLTDRNTRFLFLLDGFDELVMQGRNSGGLDEFLKQVGQFQISCQQSKEMAHRVLITGRSLALHSVERLMPPNLERVEIQPMDNQLQQQWFSKWLALVGTDKTFAFKQFLQDKLCPERVQELAREPLLLYMLAAMHRDDQLTVEMFEGASGVGAKILIYQKSLEWVLTKQRSAWLNRQLTDMETDGLQRILAEAALCVVQSGGECAAMPMVEERIQDNDAAARLISNAREQVGDDALKNALAAFYLQPKANDQGGSVEFAHKSFSEFLFAQKLQECLEEWTEPGRKGEDFLVKNAQMHWEIYDLLGYGGLTQEIVEYLMALLTDSDQFRPVQLFKRLENFYLRWCDGEFIDAAPETLPQQKMRQLQGQKIQLGVRQVDVYAGLNVMILLLELHRYAQLKDDLKAQIAFYPCGQKGTENFDEFRLLRIIGYSHCVSFGAFLETVGQFLSGANLSFAFLSGAFLRGAFLSGAYLSRADLSGADLSRAFLRGADLSRADLSGAYLSGVNLSGADLSDAYLRGAYLRGADLSGANLSDADLSGANLSDAYLSGADLFGADLSGANLRSANLRDANLSDAYLSGANLIGAILENISWDKDTNWDGVRELETAKNVPEALKQQLGLP